MRETLWFQRDDGNGGGWIVHCERSDRPPAGAMRQVWWSDAVLRHVIEARRRRHPEKVCPDRLDRSGGFSPVPWS